LIKILIVDDIPETRDHLSRLLGLERDLEVAGVAGSGEEAIKLSMDVVGRPGGACRPPPTLPP